MTNLDDEWERVRTTPSDIVDHLTYMHALAVGMNAQKVIELGVRHGTSTIAWLHALELTGGHLWSVDVNWAPFAYHYAAWTFIQGDDMDPAICNCLPLEADIVFIDTDHLYHHTLAELDTYAHHVRPGGVIVLHDTELEYSPYDRERRYKLPVACAIDTWVDDRDVVIEWRTGCNGLAVIHL